MSDLKQSVRVGDHTQRAADKADALGMFGCSVSPRLPLQQPLGSRVMNNEIFYSCPGNTAFANHPVLFCLTKISHYSSLTYFVFR